MSTEPKTPYFSISASVSEMTTQKQLGQKYIKVEVTYGNQDAIIIKGNKDDYEAITENIPLAKKIWDEYDKVKEEGIRRGHKFIEAEK